MLSMLGADALGVIGHAVALCAFGALVLRGGADALMAGVTAAVVLVGAVTGRRRLSAMLAGTGLWRASVAADGLAAMGTFTVMLHANARADHPLVLVLGVVTAALGIAAQVQIGPRTSVELTRQAGIAEDDLNERWARTRRGLQLVTLTVAVPATAVLGADVGWLAFACFVQAAEAVVVLVPFARASATSRAQEGPEA